MAQSKIKKTTRAMQVFEKLGEGLTNKQIAKELGLGVNTVSRILNGEETKKILDKADSDMTAMVERIMERANEIINEGEDSDAIKLMLAFLKTKGLVKDAVEHHHKFPKPTVIRYKDEVVKVGVIEEEGDEDGAN